MKFKLSDYENLFYILLDLIGLNLAFIVCTYSLYPAILTFYQSDHFILFIFVNFSWLFVAKFRDFKKVDSGKSTWFLLIDFIKRLVLSSILLLAFTAIVPGEYTLKYIFKLYTAFFFIGIACRTILRIWLKSHYRNNPILKRMVVVGVTPFSIDFVKKTIQHPDHGHKFLGFFGNSKENHDDIRVRKFEAIYDFLLQYEIDEVYIALPSAPDYRIKELIKFCHLNYIAVNFLNEFIHLLNKKTIQVDLDYNGPTPVVSIAKEPLEISANKLLKRTFDVVFASAVLVFIFSWLYPIIAILIKLSSRGPVLFKQKRTGMDNNSFYCYKFRTMTVNSESDIKQATATDKRITKIGAFLRRTSLDEFPQFINVLKGEMSIVGPRPHMLAHTRMYAKIIAPFMVRHWVKPGITGLAQAKGFRGETEEVRQMYHRVKLDVFYIQNWSFWMDLRLVFETFWGMITAKNTGA